MRSPRSAPPFLENLGQRPARPRRPSLAHAVNKASTNTDLPTPGAPVMAIVFQWSDEATEESSISWFNGGFRSQFWRVNEPWRVGRRSGLGRVRRPRSQPLSRRRFPVPLAALTNACIVFFRCLLDEIEDFWWAFPARTRHEYRLHGGQAVFMRDDSTTEHDDVIQAGLDELLAHLGKRWA